MKHFYFAGYYNHIAWSCTNNINSPESQNFFHLAYFLPFTHWLPTTDVYTLFLEELFVIGVYIARLLIFVWQSRDKSLCVLVQIQWCFVHHTKALTSLRPNPTAPCPRVIPTNSTICNTKPLVPILPSDQNEHTYPTNSAHYLSIKKLFWNTNLIMRVIKQMLNSNPTAAQKAEEPRWSLSLISLKLLPQEMPGENSITTWIKLNGVDKLL